MSAITETTMPIVEQWSGKDRGDENFPVGSFLIHKSLRPHVHAYYSFARNADDIADSATLSADEKIARLDLMQAVLLGDRTDGSPSAARLRESLAVTKVTSQHATDLLIAFRQDAVKHRYDNWGELIDYCKYSAMPVGRYVLDLHGETTRTYAASDALCAALQILNHLQDGSKDLRDLGRCYLPLDWMVENGETVESLHGQRETLSLRSVFDRMLDGVDALHREADALPGLCANRRIRLETAVICRLSRRLAVRLRRKDPIAGRVKLTKMDVIAATLGAFTAF